MASKELVLKETHKNLMALIESKKDAMPKGFNQTRFIQNCMTVMQDTYQIELCNPISIARTLLKGAFLDLDFFMKECYAIPYSKDGSKDLQFQTDYKGEVKLIRKYSINPVKDCYARLVREGDFFQEEVKEGQQIVNFRPIPFNTSQIVGAFAVVLYEDGSMDIETMSTEEIENIKEVFSQKSFKTKEFSKAWVATPGEMYKKTVLRRLCKHITKSFESVEQAKAFDESAEIQVKPEKIKLDVPNTFAAAVDIEYQQVEETTQPEPTSTEPDYKGTPFEEDAK